MSQDLAFPLGATIVGYPWVPSAVVCPSCSGTNLHHTRVDVFDLAHEDAPTGVHVTIRGTQLHVDTDLTANPSARRHGLRIVFRCETCPARPVLTLIQHKGRTEMQWER